MPKTVKPIEDDSVVQAPVSDVAPLDKLSEFTSSILAVGESEGEVNPWIENEYIPFGSVLGLKTPVDALDLSMKIANMLKNVLETTLDQDGKPLFWHEYSFKNKNTDPVTYTKARHPKAEAWELVTSILGCSLTIKNSEWRPDIGSLGAWVSIAQVVRNIDGVVIAEAESMCGFDEGVWKERPHFALNGMAQTRAKSRAAKTCLGYLFKLAGYESTGSEEMAGIITEEEVVSSKQGYPEQKAQKPVQKPAVNLPQITIAPSEDVEAVGKMLERLQNICMSMGYDDSLALEMVHIILSTLGQITVAEEDRYRVAMMLSNRLQGIPTNEEIEAELLDIMKINGQGEEG
jgi:hypothetical protein